MKPNLAVSIAGIKMKNPVMTAAGTFASGREYAQFVDLQGLGAIVVKAVTYQETKGNPPPRICETPSGILNSIGLQNKGVDYFIKEDLPFLRKLKVPVVVNVAGRSIAEYVGVVRQLNKARGISGLEVNISCPNVKEGGLVFGTDAKLAHQLVYQVRQFSRFPLIVKLSPNVTSITEIAESVVDAGADALSLINTVLGMAIDPQTFRPRLANIVGGLSGPAIRPIAVRMVWEVARAVDVPVIGMGGIMTTEDAVEFFLAGASAVAIGTANFINPLATMEIIRGLEKFLEEKGMGSIKELVGKVRI